MRIIDQIIAACVLTIVGMEIYGQLKHEMDEIERIFGPFPKTGEERVEWQKGIYVMALHQHMTCPLDDSEEKIPKIIDAIAELQEPLKNCRLDGGRD